METETRQEKKSKAETGAAVAPVSLVRRGALEKLAHGFLAAAVVAVFGIFVSAILISQKPPQVIAVVEFVETVIPLPTRAPTPTATPAPTPTPEPPPVALLAGHSGGNDTGALCPDGLREVDITTDVAQRAKLMLEARGYRTDILAEFDRRLNAQKRDYAPRAFVAIHVDSCVNYASGYKVARAEFSAIAGEDDRLVQCLKSAYGAATQLPFHEGSITRDMTHYHGLNEIDAKSPGAIIELGFLGSDKALLKGKRDIMAMAIADAVDAFLKGYPCQ